MSSVCDPSLTATLILRRSKSKGISSVLLHPCVCAASISPDEISAWVRSMTATSMRFLSPV